MATVEKQRGFLGELVSQFNERRGVLFRLTSRLSLMEGGIPRGIALNEE